MFNVTVQINNCKDHCKHHVYDSTGFNNQNCATLDNKNSNNTCTADNNTGNETNNTDNETNNTDNETNNTDNETNNTDNATDDNVFTAICYINYYANNNKNYIAINNTEDFDIKIIFDVFSDNTKSTSYNNHT